MEVAARWFEDTAERLRGSNVAMAGLALACFTCCCCCCLFGFCYGRRKRGKKASDSNINLNVLTPTAAASRRPAPPIGFAEASDVQISMSASVPENTAGYTASFPPGPPLPPPPPDEDEWAEAQTEAGETYYYHLVTGETAWDPPAESR